jgi:Cdc6-like AAA superfamily ATPase
MTLNSLKRLGVPFLQMVLLAFRDSVPSVSPDRPCASLKKLTLANAGREEDIVRLALDRLSELKQLGTESPSKVSLDRVSQCFTALNGHMPERELRDFDLLYLSAIIRMTLDFAARVVEEPELHAWLVRRARQDFKRLWFGLVGLRANPFSLSFPTKVPAFEAQFSRLLSHLVGRKGVVLVEGEPGTGKTAFLRKACGLLLSHQIEQKPIVTTYLENKRGSAKQFVTDLYSGFFNQYSMETPHLRQALQDSLPLSPELAESWMLRCEAITKANVFLPSHILESLFETLKLKSTDIFGHLLRFSQATQCALVVLLDDADGKIRPALSATQVNFLLSLQDECIPSFLVVSLRPRGRIARSISDRSVGELSIEGLSEDEAQSMLDAFFDDPRTRILNQSKALDEHPLADRILLKELLFADAMGRILSESYIEKRASGSVFRPRTIVSTCERIVEGVASDFSNIRMRPSQEEIFGAVKAVIQLSS